MSLFCANCGAENYEDYKFCKMCGRPFGDFVASAEENGNSPMCEEIYGVSKENISIFVGKNAYKIQSKFFGMELASSRVSWCWPLAILSYFFGFFGTAIWFFYRKMYKFAFLSVGIAVLFCVARTMLTYDILIEFMNRMYEVFSYATQNQLTDTNMLISELKTYLDGLLNNASGINYVGILADLETASSVILGGLFGLYLYKNHCIHKIKKICHNYAESPDYKFVLAQKGGVSGLMVFLGVVLMITFIGIISSVPMIAFMMPLI